MRVKLYNALVLEQLDLFDLDPIDAFGGRRPEL